MEAKSILDIPLSSPNALFPNDKDGAKRAHRKLSSHWHPDRNTDPKASEVLAHINALFDQAITLIDRGTWPSSGHVGSRKFRFATKEGASFELTYLRHRPFELGDLYVAKYNVMYVIREKYADLVERMLSTIKFTYRDPKLEKEHSKNLPRLLRHLVMKSGDHVILIQKAEDYHLLQDILDASGGSLSPRNATWIMSCLYNINCYLTIAGIAHNDISPMTVFVNAKTHEVQILGGWWYSSKVGVKPIAVPRRTSTVVTDYTVKNDTSLIRLTGREVCGSELVKAPPGVQRWLRGLGVNNGIREYQLWSEQIVPEFGPRRFEVLAVPPHIYKDTP